MKLSYFADTDTLYIDLSEKPSVESEEIAGGIVLDFDEDRHIVGLEIEDASRKVNLGSVDLSQLPTSVRRVG
jgi:uncharacterized protein YuzE